MPEDWFAPPSASEIDSAAALMSRLSALVPAEALLWTIRSHRVADEALAAGLPPARADLLRLATQLVCMHSLARHDDSGGCAIEHAWSSGDPGPERAWQMAPPEKVIPLLRCLPVRLERLCREIAAGLAAFDAARQRGIDAMRDVHAPLSCRLIALATRSGGRHRCWAPADRQHGPSGN